MKRISRRLKLTQVCRSVEGLVLEPQRKKTRGAAGKKKTPRSSGRLVLEPSAETTTPLSKWKEDSGEEREDERIMLDNGREERRKVYEELLQETKKRRAMGICEKIQSMPVEPVGFTYVSSHSEYAVPVKW